MNIAAVTKFFKEHFLGVCVFALISGLATNFVYDALKSAVHEQRNSPLQTPSASLNTTGPTMDEVQRAIGAMVKEVPGAFPLRINIITGAVNGMSVVAITPPYREFPNVVIFHYDDSTKRWKRIVENLCIGIQPQVSKRLDLHTISEAVDIEPVADKEHARENQIRDIAAIGAGRGLITVAYDKFIHCHACGQETYTIDKRGFSRLRERLFPTGHYPDDVCTWFDIPDLSDVSLSYASGRFELTASTVNGQKWRVTFTGIDAGGYLQQRFIAASNDLK